MQLRL
jgi:hypothetical protein